MGKLFKKFHLLIPTAGTGMKGWQKAVVTKHNQTDQLRKMLLKIDVSLVQMQLILLNL